jgi:hypothetical protein
VRVAGLAAALALTLVGCSGTEGVEGAASSPTATTAEPSAPSARPLPQLPVREPVVWLCLPGTDDATCTQDLDAAVVTAEGTTLEPFEPADDPPVDCFYVYPTVSGAPDRNAPKEPDADLVATVRAQAAPFSEVCRVFAPVYRQITVAGLFDGGFSDPAAQALALDDVRDAWHAYLNEHNDGRGVVLIGHSQGGIQLGRLLAADIAARPAALERVVSALLLGALVTVPEGSDVADQTGGLPACRTPGQTGCVVAYSTFAEVPPEGALFGRAPAGRQALCTDPTRLSGGDGRLHPYVPTSLLSPGGSPGRAVPPPPGTEASFVVYPEAGTAECRQESGASWLHVEPVPGAPGPAALESRSSGLAPGWGLHTVDVTLALGDLVEVVRRQAEAWTG